MILIKNWKSIKAINFKLTKIKREDVANYPDDINKALKIDFSFGGYFEKINFYNKTESVIHTGLDIFEKAGEKIIAPFDGYILEWVYANPKNYQIGRGAGEQLICWHTFDQVAKVLGKTKTKKIFKNYQYLKIVYAHINAKNKSLWSKKTTFKKNDVIIRHSKINKKIAKGKVIASVASRYNNGGWIPHIHIETSLENEIKIIKTKKMQQITDNSLIELVKKDNQKKLDAINLIDPKIVFGFHNLNYETKIMDLKKIDQYHKIITIHNLSFEYEKNKPVLKNISFDIKEGEIISILGPSGSGKTTLLNAITGFINYKGKVLVKNCYSTNNIGYVFEDNLVYETLSVYRNIWISAINNDNFKYQTYFEIWQKNVELQQEKDEINNIISMQKLYHNAVINKWKFIKRFNKFKKKYNDKYQKIDFKKVVKSQIIKLMRKLKISNLMHQKAISLSGGQKQRVAIARSVIKKPRILIMDEPLNSLDENIKDQTRELIWKLQKELKITLIFVTNNQKEAMLIADKIMILKNGKLIQYDTPQKIYNHPNNEFVAKFIGWPKINLVATSKKTKTFVRPHHIIIRKNQKSNIFISGKKFIDKNIIYNLNYKKKEIKVVSNLNFKIGDKVSAWWNKKDEKIFKNEN